VESYQGLTGTIQLDDENVTILRDGRGKFFGVGSESRVIPIASLSGVTMTEPGRVRGGLLQLELQSEPRTPPKLDDPNTVHFAWGEREAFGKLATTLRERIMANATHAHAATALPERSQASFAGITLFETTIRAADGDGGPLDGARATVDTAGQLTRRITLTRVVLTGPLALGWRKKLDDRELYLVIEGEGWATSAAVDPKLGEEARAFAAKINAAATRSSTEQRDASRDDSDPLQQLRALADLRDAGVITDDEFEAKKTDLLGRI
jgi:hypothetical protein